MAVSPPGTPAISGERNSDKETFPSCGNFHAPCGCQLGPTRETGSSRRCPGARVHIHPTKHLAGYQALMGKLHADSPLASRSLSGCSRTQQTQHRRRPSRMGPAVAARHCLGPPHPQRQVETQGVPEGARAVRPHALGEAALVPNLNHRECHGSGRVRPTAPVPVSDEGALHRHRNLAGILETSLHP